MFTLPEVPCPIPDGEYAMTTIVDDSGTRLCENQPDSTVMVTGSSFMINYCSEGITNYWIMLCSKCIIHIIKLITTKYLPSLYTFYVYVRSCKSKITRINHA